MTQTIEQLKNRSWTSFRKAADALKAAGFPVQGEDYEIREAIKGSFQIMPPDDTAATAKPVANGQAELAERILAAGSFDVSFNVSPSKRVSATAATIAEAAATRDRLNAEHGRKGRTAKVFAIPADGGAAIPVADTMLNELLGDQATTVEEPEPAEEKTIPPAEPAKPADDAPQNDMTPLPTEGGPYTLQIAYWPQHDIPGGAVKASVAMGAVVLIHDKHDKVVRSIDGRLAKPEPKAPRTPKANGEARKTGEARKPNENLLKAIELAQRPEGVTREQIRQLVTDRNLPWTMMFKDVAKRNGWAYSTSEATGGNARVAYHLKA